jgi:hypothetical protein
MQIQYFRMIHVTPEFLHAQTVKETPPQELQQYVHCKGIWIKK